MNHPLRQSLASLVFTLLLFVGGVASAQPRVREPIDVERFEPHITYDGFVNTEGSDVRPEADRWEAGLYLNYGLNQLVVVNGDNTISDRFVSGRLGFDLIGSVTIIGPFALGIGMPLFLAQSGDEADLDGDGFAESPSFAGLGDLRLAPKVRLLDDREIVGLAIIGDLRLPTHAGDFSGGARMVSGGARLALDHRFGGSGFRLGANAGVVIREGTVFENVNALSEYVYAVAASYRIGGWDGLVTLGAEVNGATALTSDVAFEELPLEAFLFGKIHATKEWTVSFGPSLGIVPGYGIPTFRVFAGVRYTPTNNDRDGDGIPDDEDACPDTVVTDPDSGVAYMMVAAHMDWSHAQANCAAYGYTLVTIEDTAENDLVWELIYEGEDGLGHIDAHTWIGYRQPVGDSWQWDGVSTSYENFDSEVITDDYGTVYFGQAAAFGDAADMYWHEAPQTWRYASVCESP